MTTCNTTAMSSTARTTQSNSPAGPCSNALYALSLSRPMNAWRFPAMCRITKPMPISPVTAIMTFLPTVERETRNISTGGNRKWEMGSGRRTVTLHHFPFPISHFRRSKLHDLHGFQHRIRALLQRCLLVRRQLDFNDLLQPLAPQLARHAEVHALHAVLALEPRGTGQNALLIADDGFRHLHGARRRRIVRRSRLEELHNLGAAVAGAI